MDGINILSALMWLQSGRGLARDRGSRFQRRRQADILWQNADGTPAVWLMNGLSVLAGQMSDSIRALRGRHGAGDSMATAKRHSLAEQQREPRSG